MHKSKWVVRFRKLNPKFKEDFFDQPRDRGMTFYVQPKHANAKAYNHIMKRLRVHNHCALPFKGGSAFFNCSRKIT